MLIIRVTTALKLLRNPHVAVALLFLLTLFELIGVKAP